ncbi:unnamed protein product, partial [Amoebophrya sp. A120]
SDSRYIRVEHCPDTGDRFFWYLCERYVLSPSRRDFVKAPTSLSCIRQLQACAELTSCGSMRDRERIEKDFPSPLKPLDSEVVGTRQRLFGENAIQGVPEPTLGACIIEEFTGSFFYIFQLMSFWLWASVEELHIGLVWEFIFVLSGLWNARNKRDSLQQVHRLAKYNAEVMVLRHGRESWIYPEPTPMEVSSTCLVPGDHIRVNTGMTLTCDCILVQGDNLIMNEAALTGEATPVQKFSVQKSELIEVGLMADDRRRDDMMQVANTRNMMSTTFNNTSAPPQRVTDLSSMKQHILFAGTQVFSGGGVAVVYAIGVGTTRGSLIRQMLLEGSDAQALLDEDHHMGDLEEQIAESEYYACSPHGASSPRFVDHGMTASFADMRESPRTSKESCTNMGGSSCLRERKRSSFLARVDSALQLAATRRRTTGKRSSKCSLVSGYSPLASSPGITMNDPRIVGQSNVTSPSEMRQGPSRYFQQKATAEQIHARILQHQHRSYG